MLRNLAQFSFFGVVAQLGERLNGIQEVEGSTPFDSTQIQVEIAKARTSFWASFFAGFPVSADVRANHSVLPEHGIKIGFARLFGPAGWRRILESVHFALARRRFRAIMPAHQPLRERAIRTSWEPALVFATAMQSRKVPSLTDGVGLQHC